MDVHRIVLPESGDGIYLLENGEEWRYPATGLAGEGLLLGRRVRCLTPAAQMLCHTGYPPQLGSYDDIWALSQRFGLPVPGEYRGPHESYRQREA